MYNPRLDTFLHVADAGSFNRAAEESYITPTAVIKQINLLEDELWKNHPQINIVDFEFYNMDVFNRCENSNNVLLAISGWANVHPLLKLLPVDWDFGIPYGLLHSPNPSETVKRFLKAVSKSINN